MDRENFLLEIADKDEQFAISFELLCLLRWLIEHESYKIKKMVTQALTEGLAQQLDHLANYSDNEALEEAQENMIEFFRSLESMLMETLQEQALNIAREKNLMPAIEHIDTTICDEAVLKLSLAKARNKIIRNPRKNSQEILLKEILGNWSPGKKDIAH
jgi:hypothetical protein